MIRHQLLIYLFFVLAACDSIDTMDIAVVGNVERSRVELVAESNDPITAIHVKEGDPVKAGDIILEQDPALYLSRLQQLQAARDRAQYRMDELVRGPRMENITAARAKLQGAVNNLTIQEREHERVTRLVQDKLASPSLLDQALEQKEAAHANRDQAQAELDALLAGTTEEELDQIRAALAETEAAVTAQQLLVQRLTLRVPRNGIIDALPYEAGERPPPGSTVAVMLAEELPYARVYIPEPIRGRIIPGTAAEIRVDGIDSIFQGRVRYVSSEAAFTPYYALTQRDRSRLSYLAEIDFTETSAANLPGGVPVAVTFPSLTNNQAD